MEIYRTLANFVFLFHMVWIILLMGGIPTALVWPSYRPVHLFVVAFTLVSQILFLGCPLTLLESTLRAQYDPNTAYIGSFVCYILNDYFSYKVPPESITLLMAAIGFFTLYLVIPEKKKQKRRHTSTAT